MVPKYEWPKVLHENFLAGESGMATRKQSSEEGGRKPNGAAKYQAASTMKNPKHVERCPTCKR